MIITHERTSCPCSYCGKKYSDVRIIVGRSDIAFGYTYVDYICSECAEEIRRHLYNGPKRDWAYLVKDLREWHKAIKTAPELVNLSTLLEAAADAILELSGVTERKLKITSKEMKG